MGRKMRHRQGKVSNGGHSTMIEGLRRFVQELEGWSEVSGIRVGRISSRNSTGRSGSKLIRTSEGELTPRQSRKRAKGGGGFDFKATRWAMIGDRITGIHCVATYGRSMQDVVLISDDLDRLKRRLQREGYCAKQW